MKRQLYTTLSIAVLLGFVSFLGCGLGGGSEKGVQVGPAVVDIIIPTREIDSGDRTEITLDIFNIQINKFALKIRFPVGLQYVSETSFFVIRGVPVDTGPDENKSDGTNVYLVYYIDGEKDFLPEAEGSLKFQLEGVANVPQGLIEVDVDVDNPDIDNDVEFDIANPKFDAQVDSDIRVGPAPTSASGSTSGAASSVASSVASSASSGSAASATSSSG